MTTQPPYQCIPLSQVADPSTLWGLVLEEVSHADPETTMLYIVQRPKDQAVAQESVALLMGFPAPATEAISA